MTSSQNMKKEKSFNIKSELLNDNLETIYPVYLNFKELVTDYNLNLDTDDEFDIQILFESLYLNALYYWEEIYPKFVLDPIKKEITEAFIEAQKTNFKLKEHSKFEEKIYLIHYYILQYFSIGIKPYHEHESFPNLGLKTANSGNLNLLLYNLFTELWHELKIDSLIDYELFDERSEFYNIEVKLLSDFLSKCWNEAKLKTNVKSIGILVESTAVGQTYSLDENRVLKDYDDNPMY
ncbi:MULTISPECIES: hypothetical protein [unclassified Tenacibaculum]|uniref:hypothetical protein n=1 Tax=unclassified Tenacibaculum TaxID=2635139 RepID=UPI001F373791|nr:MULTISPECIES: hypothetical protein [unclassified Tenacibaculum]MCF2875925.1 hypothetical protein [Tenacibaculum sp. Cn5-1]MCF2936000.1 hypothetical protein [Tenacibaculum sp. Cn5-34]MCG7512561.1 hypothetical protein [Tenacibaculum sp. Cn5-46]